MTGRQADRSCINLANDYARRGQTETALENKMETKVDNKIATDAQIRGR